MLKRLISEDRLERGIWTSASDFGKCWIVFVGLPCFLCWSWVIGLLFVAGINLHNVIAHQSNLVLEVKCGGQSHGIPKDGLHHLTGCKFKQTVANNEVTIHVGSFKWGPGAPCGTIAEKMDKGELLQGSPLSFIGNVSDGVMKAWRKDNAVICGFMEGDVSAGVMMQDRNTEGITTTCIGMLFVLFLLSWASCCLFFPDRNSDELTPDANRRACMITLVAAGMSCFGSVLSYMYGSTGLFIGGVIILLVLCAGCSDSFTESMRQMFEKREYDIEDPEDPDEERPLLVDNSAPSYGEARPLPTTGQPLPPAGAEQQQEPEGDSGESGYKQQGGGTEFLAAICLGIFAGLAGGILLSVVLSIALG